MSAPERSFFYTHETTSQIEKWSRDWRQESDTIAQELHRRIRLFTALAGDQTLRAAALIACKNDPFVWIDDYVVTYDPRNRSPLPKTIPLKLWPRQREMVSYIRELFDGSESGMVKKSRDMGATWITAAMAVWLWLFFDMITVKFGSRTERKVDRLGDSEAIFWKIRFILRNLPSWMLPLGFDVGGKHDNHLRILNPENGSQILGEGGDEMGRGGRASIYFIDEFAKVARASGVWASVTDNSDVVILVSTSGGTGTKFWELEQQRTIRVFRFHYTDDPRKDAAWATFKLRLLGSSAFAREHDMDDSAALDFQIVEARWANAAVDFAVPTGGVSAFGLDPADTGDDETSVAIRSGARCSQIVATKHELDAALFSELAAMVNTHGAQLVVYDRIGVGAGTKAALSPFVGAAMWGVGNNERVPATWFFDDDPDRPAVERFSDMGTALWWNLRIRFRKTYEVVEGIADHPLEECISIPDDPILIAQLTSRQYQQRGDKIACESKERMGRRGVSSPDRAESLAYAFIPYAIPTAQRVTSVASAKPSRARSLFQRGW